MVKIKGVCKNIDECSKADEREVQIIDESAPFICGECEDELFQKKQKIKGKLLIILVSAAVGMAIIVGIGFYFGIGGGISTDEQIRIDSIRIDSIRIDSIRIDSIRIDSIARLELDGTHNLGYATWSGKLHKGKPHDNAQMTFKKRHLIEPRDMKSRYAAAGDYIIGTYKNGHLIHGRWYKKDGNIETITIGESASDDE